MLNVPFRSMSTTVPKPFADRSSAAHTKLPAAPFTRMSKRPNRATVCSTTDSTAAGSRTSDGNARARTPSDSIARAAGSRCSARRLVIATCAPCAASASAIPWQIPVPPPVTSATCPLKRPDANVAPCAVMPYRRNGAPTADTPGHRARQSRIPAMSSRCDMPPASPGAPTPL